MALNSMANTFLLKSFNDYFYKYFYIGALMIKIFLTKILVIKIFVTKIFKFFKFETQKQALHNKHLVLCMLYILVASSGNLVMATPNVSSENYAIALQKQYQSLNNDLMSNQFNRPLVLKSTETDNQLKGEIYAVLDYPFATVKTALNSPNSWCNALILHINVKYCDAQIKQSGSVIHLNLGKKYDQPLEDTYKASFNYTEITKSDDYFSTELKAALGPLGTRDYRIWVEATPLKNGRTFLHFTYAYSFGLTGRLAMKGYLATLGRDKVGFTLKNNASDDKNTDTKTQYIQGVRGVVERNTMRYYLALDAYLASLNLPKSSQTQASLNAWFDATEAFAQQLHEVSKEQYLTMKSNEIKRNQALIERSN